MKKTLHLPTPDQTFSDADYEAGCEFCGRMIPAQPFNGLERAHIISSAFGPEHRWNVVLLCPTCHHLFDHAIKPIILNAVKHGAEGFYENPVEAKKQPTGDIVAGLSYPEILSRMLPRDFKQLITLPREISKNKIWCEQPARKKSQKSGAS